MTLLDRLELVSSLKLDRRRCNNYIRAIELRYQDNPYHNRIHATDVLQAVGVILFTDNFLQHFSNIELLALILSAAVHDVCHPGGNILFFVRLMLCILGVNNDFHVRSKSELAAKYSNSINERMHIAKACEILRDKKDQNWAETMHKEDFELLKRYVNGIILKTDMAVHDKLVGKNRKYLLDNKRM